MSWKDAFLDELIQIKLAQFVTSQFSGPTGEGPRVARMTSFIPPRVVPPLKVKQAFQVSQFSGPLSMGSFKMTSYTPPFQQTGPKVKVVPSTGMPMDPTAGVQVKRAGAGMGDNIPTITSPKRVLSQTQRVGQAQISPQPGPSIYQQTNPINFGKGSAVGPPIPGATKS